MCVITGIENTIWMLRRNGTLICLTTSLEGSIQGFSTHQTDGYIEDICVQYSESQMYIPQHPVAPPISLPMLHLSVIRNGVRYVEKMNIRDDSDPTTMLFADACKTFGELPPTILDPNGAPSNLLNITTDTDYKAGSVLTLTEKGLIQYASEPNDGYWFADNTTVYDFNYDVVDTNGNLIRVSKFRIFIDSVEYVILDGGLHFATILKGHAIEDVPAYLQDISSQTLSADEIKRRQSNFMQATRYLSGLTHLANRAVSIFADGSVISSPNNPEKDALVVANDGTLDLGDYYDYGYVGLPYTMDMETLDIEAADSRTYTNTEKLIDILGIGVRRTNGGFVGQSGTTDLLNMQEFKTRTNDSIEDATTPYDGYLEFTYPSTWDATGRVLIKQVDPLPMTILSVYPKGVKGD